MKKGKRPKRRVRAEKAEMHDVSHKKGNDDE
jgi:hypothetical protein